MRRFHTFFSSLLLALAGCNGESSDTAKAVEERPEPPVQEAALDISGRVVFGFAEDAEVRLYSGATGSDVIGSTSSDLAGSYELSVDSKYLFEPAVLEVRITANKTLLLCTSTMGCANKVQFGEKYLAEEDLVLFAAVSRLQRDVPQNISILTDMAYAQVDIDGGDGRAEPSDTLSRQLAYAKANSQVASRFKINGDLTSQGVLDFTNRVEVLAGWRNALLFSAMGASLVEAAQEALGSASAIAAYRSFRETYLSQGLADNSSLADTVTYADALLHVLRILAAYEHESSYVSSLASELAAARAVALLEKPDQFDKGTASETIGQSAIAKGKSFVENIRQVASSIDLNKLMSLRDLSGFLDGAAAGALDDFGVKIEAAEVLNGEEPQHLIDALKKVGKSVLSAATTHYFGDSTGSTIVDGVLVTVEDRGDAVAFSVDQLIPVCDAQQNDCIVSANITIVINAEMLSGSADGLALAAEKIRVVMSGSLTSGTLSMELAPSQDGIFAEELYLTLSESEQLHVEASSLFLKAEALDAAFRVHIARSGIDHLVSVNALVEFSASDLALHIFSEKATTVTSVESTSRYDRSIIIEQMAELEASVGAVIERGYEESFLAGVNFRAAKPDGVGVMEYATSRTETCSLMQEPGCELIEGESSFTGESEQEFLEAAVSTLFKAHLKGVAEPVFVQISGSREAPSRNKLDNLKVTYPGHAISLNGQFNNSGGITSMNATNLDGMRMFIDSDAGKRSGAVTGPGGERVAEIEDGGDWVKIRFNDGFFVSM